MKQKVVVITGSTRGIGLGLARSFLKAGWHVLISGRSQTTIDMVLKTEFKEMYNKHLAGQVCDVSKYDEVQTLWDSGVAQFGQIDIWINNAGVGQPSIPFWEQHSAKLEELVRVNLLGVMYGTQVAMGGMISQGWGRVYNMEGLGSDGRMLPGQTTYGTTKRALSYFTKSLSKEIRDTPVSVAALSPGMVITDLLLGNVDASSPGFAKAKHIFNILAEHVDTVAPWLVQHILAQSVAKDIRWLTRRRIGWRFLSAPFRKRNLF